MPGLDGIEATRRIVAGARRRRARADRVLRPPADPRRAGGRRCGYLLKDAAADEVAEGIRAAAGGESPLDPRAARTVLRRAPSPTRSPASPARARGARAARGGTANKLIARRLEISEKTVKSHLTRIFRESA